MTDDFDTIIDIDRPLFGPTVALAMDEEAARYIALVMEEEFARSADGGAFTIAQAIRAAVSND